MSNGKSVIGRIVGLGETAVGKSEMADALGEHLRSMVPEGGLVVLDGSQCGAPQGMIGRLIGHPAGYVGYDDKDRERRGLLATLCLERMKHGPAIFLDDEEGAVPVSVN